jgi:hypothetical protein
METGEGTGRGRVHNGELRFVAPLVAETLSKLQFYEFSTLSTHPNR